MKNKDKSTLINHQHVCAGNHSSTIETFDPPVINVSENFDPNLSPPTVIIPVVHTPFFIGFRFHHNGANANGFIFKISQGDNLIKYQALHAYNRSTPLYNPISLGITDYSTPLTFEILATTQNGGVSESIKLENVSIQARDIKSSSYDFTYEFNTMYGVNAETNLASEVPWTPEEISNLRPRLDGIINYYKSKYKNPVTNIPLIVTKLVNASYAIKIVNIFEIRVSPDIDERLLAHELFHAWWCPALFSMDDNWMFDTTHTWMEEGLAEWSGREYAALTDPDNFSQLWNHNIYDLQNKNYLASNVNYFDLLGGEGFVARILYGLAATAFNKLNTTNSYSIPWMYDYYAYLVNSGRLKEMLTTKSRKEIYLDLITTAFNPESRIEGLKTRDWLEKQQIFSGELKKGPRVFERIEYYFIHSYTYNPSIFYLIDVFDNGQSWVEYDKNPSNPKIINRYKRNGTGGRLTVTDWNNKIIFEGNVKIEPEENPPETTIRGGIYVNLINVPKEVNSEVYDNYSKYHNITVGEKGLYKIKIEFNIENGQTVSLENYRPIGLLDEQKHPNGVVIGVPDSKYYNNFKVNGITYEAVNDVIIVPELTSEFLKLTYEGSGRQYKQERILPESKKVNVILFDKLNDGF